MQTLRLTIDPYSLDCDSSRAALDAAASIIRAGGLVAFPTETVYGLGANALDAEAVEKIFLAKLRPAWDPLIVHISALHELSNVVATESPARSALTRSANALMKAFWPGPLTLLLPRAATVPPIVTAGLPLIAVRMPSHPVASALISKAGVPIAAPSANTFGRVSPTRASHVLEDLDGRIDAILDGGETVVGLESTVVDASREPMVLYRPGVISLLQIRELCGSVVEWKPPATSVDAAAEPPESMPSPGIGLRHYAPRAQLIPIGGPPAEQPLALLNAARAVAAQHDKIGVMLPTDFLPASTTRLPVNTVIFDWGSWDNLPELAHRLFAGLRELDAVGVRVIVCPLPLSHGLGAAIMDRLLKAAKQQ